MSVKEEIIEKLDRLSEPKLQEVLSFVEFLIWKSDEPEDSILSVAGTLLEEAFSADEIEQALYGNTEVG
jgi:hypothetical protein